MEQLSAIFQNFRPNWPGLIGVGLGLVASFYGAYRIHALRSPGKGVPAGTEEFEGIGGWLILIMIGLAIRIYVYAKAALLAFGLTCNLTKLDALTSVGAPAYSPFWSPCLFFEAIGSFAMVTLCVLAFIVLFQKKFTFPYVMIGVLVGSLSFHVVDHTLASQIATIPHDNAAFIGTLFRYVLVCCIWIPYFLVSKRVQATFRF